MSKKVLVVEDHTDIRRMMKIMLELQGFDVAEASDGYEAVEKALDEPPDVILMDMAMPVLDGVYSTRALRQHEEFERIPIIALTAYGEFYDERARAAGCTDVLQKPIDFSALKPLVQHYTA
jgi:CheY-like chemotaxis protein